MKSDDCERRVSAFFRVLETEEVIAPVVEEWIFRTANVANEERISCEDYFKKWFDLWTDPKGISLHFMFDSLRLFEGDKFFIISVAQLAKRHPKLANAFVPVMSVAFDVWPHNTMMNRRFTLMKFKYNTSCHFESLARTVLRVLRRRVFIYVVGVDDPVARVWDEFVERYARKCDLSARILDGLSSTQRPAHRPVNVGVRPPDPKRPRNDGGTEFLPRTHDAGQR